MTGAMGILVILLSKEVGEFGGAGLHLAIAIPLSFIIALGIGFANGWMVEKTLLPSFIVTLATFFVLRGLKLGLSKLIVDQIQVGDIRDAAHLHGGVPDTEKLAARSVALCARAVRTPADEASAAAAVASLAHALRVPSARKHALAADVDVPALLRPLLAAGLNSDEGADKENAAQLAQAAYDACICAWLLAFDEAATARLAAAGCAAPLVALVCPGAAARPKVGRAAALALHNVWFTAETGSAAAAAATAVGVRMALPRTHR